MEDQQAESAQFSRGASQELGSQNYTILGGNWQLAVGSLAEKLLNSWRELVVSYWGLAAKIT